MKRFFRFQLRTTDVPAARAFYSTVLGEGAADIVPLPEQVVARGVPAHWLGHVGVEDVEAAVRAFVERGAIQLGPTRQTSDGGRVAILRDPGEAIVAVATTTAKSPQPEVAWQHLHATNVQRTVAAYCDLFGWQRTARRDLGKLGVHQEFTWHAGEPTVGSVVDVAELAGVHSHWLFYFRVAALEPAIAAVRTGGGIIIGPTELPQGDRVAVCEDPQRGAFGLYEGSPRHGG